MKKSALLLCFILLLQCVCVSAGATETAEIYPYDAVIGRYWLDESVPSVAYEKNGDAKSLILMEYSTGKILFAENENEHLPIASVTKVMSTLLVMEAIDSGRITLGDSVTVSANAASMGGSQVFLEEGETMSVDDLLKSLVVVSANDATVALAEYVCGSEGSFVSAMNARALELGCSNTHFANTNGLPIENHYSSAYDVAVMTRELMKHRKIFDYTTIWMDTIRNGSFGLANTNKLVRFYKGATGMKTGFTGEAKYCLSGTASRDGMELIAVVLGASTSDIRFAEAKSMLDYGFANYRVITPEAPSPEPIKVNKGTESSAILTFETPSLLLEKGTNANIEATLDIAESIDAPVAKGTVVGYISFTKDGTEIAKAEVRTDMCVDRIGYGTALVRLLKEIFAFL